MRALLLIVVALPILILGNAATTCVFNRSRLIHIVAWSPNVGAHIALRQAFGLTIRVLAFGRRRKRSRPNVTGGRRGKPRLVLICYPRPARAVMILGKGGSRDN